MPETQVSSGGTPDTGGNSPNPPVDTSKAAGTLENSSTGITKEIEDILNFDPFPDGIAPKEPKQSPGAAPQGTTTTAPKADGGTPAQPEKKVEAVEDPLTGEYKKILAHKDTLIEQALAASKPAPQDDGKAPESKDETPPYSFNVPDELVNLLASDDPKDRKGAITALLSGMGRAIHKEIVSHMGKLVPNSEAITSQVQTILRASQEREAVKADFFGKYPELNKPELGPLLAQIALQVTKEQNKTTWDAAVRDETARRVKALFGAVVPVNPQQPQQPVSPPASFGGNQSRPASAGTNGAQDPNSPDNIAAVLGF